MWQMKLVDHVLWMYGFDAFCMTYVILTVILWHVTWVGQYPRSSPGSRSDVSNDLSDQAVGGMVSLSRFAVLRPALCAPCSRSLSIFTYQPSLSLETPSFAFQAFPLDSVRQLSTKCDLSNVGRDCVSTWAQMGTQNSNGQVTRCTFRRY